MAGNSGDSQLFEETFVITEIDHKKYDRAARLEAESTDFATKLTLDYHTELFPLHEGETIHLVLATTLNLDGSKDENQAWRDASKAGGEASLADMYDYVCCGKIYKFEEGEEEQTTKAYISYGGLLMSLEGPMKKLSPLHVDQVYLLVKK